MPDFSPAADTYLDRLANELRAVREPLRGDIWSGIAEELDGLAETDARSRIAELGDPSFIAREARNAVDVGTIGDTTSTGYTTVVAQRPPLSESRGLAVLGAIALGVGGFVVPFVGWVVGVVLVWMSSLWRTREKVIAIVGPFVVLILAAVVSRSINGWAAVSGTENPLVPVIGDIAVSSVIGALLLNVIAMVWLLVRLGRR
ncbi:hypothetical protein ELQ90_00730 [Labedella phragmitis]|uniref:Uncharacterized protein n=1 Tax=Labedella phragmitis TaxID=2498849 RepID=A0A3S3ZCJ0_9MICO|nr:hypothetical protein [Labedella phragmitis]RWZ52517.1 hypothetical protein ELQ90_00730 [Labedella phragmitis]